MSRCIVSVGTGNHRGKLARLTDQVFALGENFFFWDGYLPMESPSHEEAPYAFKVWALRTVLTRSEGLHHDVLLWLDSSIIILKPLAPIWELIEQQGYWFSRNHNYSTGNWASDASLPILGITREEAFGIPQIVATSFGLDLRQPVAQDFLSRWRDLALAGAFAGPWSNEHGEASSDPRVKGHRHDQTAASVLVHRMGLNLTVPPEYFSDEGFPYDERTILTTDRTGWRKF